MKEIMNKQDQSIRGLKISKLKEKIDSIVDEGIWDFDDVFF